MQYLDWGLIDYEIALGKQRELFHLGIAQRKSGEDLGFKNQVVFCEHPHIYTIGRNAGKENLMVEESILESKGIQCIRVERGGDITYHGPGQIVVYPILNLKDFNLYIREFVLNLEEVVIRTLADFQIEASRLASAPGVWIEPEDAKRRRKIAAIGVRASRFISMHGFSLNVNTDMSYFKLINPCGFQPDSVTSMQKELGKPVPPEDVKASIKHYFNQLFIK